MINMRRTIVLYLLSILSVSAFGQNGGKGIYQFLDLPISARVTALGGNLIAVKDNDLNVSLTNPSLLTDSMDNNIALSYINFFGGIKYGYAAYAKHFNKIGNFSAGIHYVDYGKFIRADEIGNTDGYFYSQDMSFNIAYERSILDSNLTVGATLKTIYSHLDTYTSSGSVLDLGATYLRPKSNFAIAYVIKNLGEQWKSYVPGNKEKMPFEMQLGISKKPKHVPLRLSVVYENLQKWDLTYVDPATATVDPLTGVAISQNKYKAFGDKLMRHIVVGGEFIITKNIFLRLGYNYRVRKEMLIPEKRGADGFSFGFGFRVYKFHFSYGRSMYHLAGSTNNISLSFDINSFCSKRFVSTK